MGSMLSTQCDRFIVTVYLFLTVAYGEGHGIQGPPGPPGPPGRPGPQGIKGKANNKPKCLYREESVLYFLHCRVDTVSACVHHLMIKLLLLFIISKGTLELLV